MSIKTTKRVVSRFCKVGESRVAIRDYKAAREALTADDMRELVRTGAIEILPAKGIGRAKARRKQQRKEAGRRRGSGSRKGSQFSKSTRKDRWVRKVRAQRKALSNVKPRLAGGAYRELYSQVKGGLFRDKKHLLSHAVSKGYLR
jgi:large subunit ribosomal protein L19e